MELSIHCHAGVEIPSHLGTREARNQLNQSQNSPAAKNDSPIIYLSL